MAFPDVCLTPAPPAPPIPIPYPNLASLATMPGFPKVLVGGMPVLNALSIAPLTNGDQAGLNGGVACGMIMGPAQHITASSKVLMGPAPVTRMTDPSLHNGINAPGGVALGPAQTKMMVLS